MRLIHAGTACGLIAKTAVLLAVTVLCMAGGPVLASATRTLPHNNRKKAMHVRRPPVRPAPILPQEMGVLPPVTLDQLPAAAPRVRYGDRQLTIDSQNSTFSDVLKAVCRKIGADLDLPAGAGNERVVVHMSGTTRQAIRELLNGSNLNYIILGSPENPDGVGKLILTKLNAAPGESQLRVVQPQSFSTAAPGIIQSTAIGNVLAAAPRPACPQYIHKPFPDDEDYQLTPECANALEQTPMQQQGFRQPLPNVASSAPAEDPDRAPVVVRRPFPDDDDFSPDH